MIKYHKFNSSTHWIIHTLNKKPEASLDNALKDNNVTTRAWTINLQGINSSQIRYKFIQFDTSQNFAIVCCQLLAEFDFIVIDRFFVLIAWCFPFLLPLDIISVFINSYQIKINYEILNIYINGINIPNHKIDILLKNNTVYIGDCNDSNQSRCFRNQRLFIISLGPHIKHIPWLCGRSYLPHSKGHIIMVARFTL